MTAPSDGNFKHKYQTHLKHLRLKGLQPKTIEAYSRAIRRIGAYFDHQIDDLSEQQLIDYFTDLLDSHSWSASTLIKTDPVMLKIIDPPDAQIYENGKVREGQERLLVGWIVGREVRWFKST
jgi:hypothetical protein